MTHAEVVQAVAKALQAEYSAIERQPAWDDLHQDAQADWCHLARVAINTYNASKPDG
jgi:hypothetical protein